ncbi:hypothetical protein [Haloferula rosea]|uniref:Uncharacterized protein n=1 Tax=Haloferula rosea TaxID=490093 RepID=A0A934RDM2_9BACT|nr:hypothetical protein [Haloferula rosea]MBK1827141.1 hypothetical protein [Haloferula rosea]
MFSIILGVLGTSLLVRALIERNGLSMAGALILLLIAGNQFRTYLRWARSRTCLVIEGDSIDLQIDGRSRFIGTVDEIRSIAEDQRGFTLVFPPSHRIRVRRADLPDWLKERLGST